MEQDVASLQEYRAFLAVVETGSVSKAAQALYRSASAVSKQLAKLEQDLEVQLIDRTTQSVVVTRRGHDFYARCKEILASVDEAERAVKEDLASPSGRLSISIPEGLVNSRLMSHLADFAQTYPGVRFNVSVSNKLEDLIENQIDFAFRVAKTADERLVAFELADMRMVAVASKDYLARVNLPETIGELIDGNHIIVPIDIDVPRAIAEIAPERARSSFDLQPAPHGQHVLGHRRYGEGGARRCDHSGFFGATGT
ncbi:MAG: LysR family transcriptional regulator [Gammaproteobacteria bacterium]|nr:LysR family transcriptional regulator [Gammaproteobacteria bacterium]